MPVSLKKVLSDLPADRRAAIEARARELITAEQAARGRPKRSVPRYHVFRDASGIWRWRLVASNGAVIANSGEGYSTKTGCLSAIGRVKAAADAEIAVDA
jgi:uncharacterized protein